MASTSWTALHSVYVPSGGDKRHAYISLEQAMKHIAYCKQHNIEYAYEEIVLCSHFIEPRVADITEK